jgi:hypothetical protein
MHILNVAEAAALLTELGIHARDGGPVKEDTLRLWLQQGKFPNARCFAGRRGFWVIPRADVEAFAQQQEKRSPS